MWIENKNFDIPKNNNVEKKECSKYDSSNIEKKINKIKSTEIEKRKNDNKEAERLIADVKFNVQEWKDITKWKVCFSIADINWSIDIDADNINLNDRTYKIHMPKWADLSSLHIKWDKLYIKWKVWFFSGTWSVEIDRFKKEVIKLSSQDIKEDIIHTKSWDLTLSKL